MSLGAEGAVVPGQGILVFPLSAITALLVPPTRWLGLHDQSTDPYRSTRRSVLPSSRLLVRTCMFYTA